MPCDTSQIRKALRGLAVTVLALLPVPAFAEQVTLKSADGTVNIVGEFVEFTDGNYVVTTDLGDLTISSSRVRCEGAACPVIEVAVADVKIVGSDTVGEGMMPLLMDGFGTFLDAEGEVENTQTAGQFIARFVGEQGFGDPIGSYLVTSTTSGDAFKGLLDGAGEIGMASRRIRPEEARALRDAGGGNMISPEQEHIIAVDSLIVIVHPDNPLTSISLTDLARIYAGEVTNWSEIGGDNQPIKVITRQEGSGTLAVFQAAIFGENVPPTPATFVVADENTTAADMVNEDPTAITFVGNAFQRGAKPLNLITECGIEAVADAFAAKIEEYPLERRLYLYNRSDKLSDLAKKFLDFASAEAADQVIAQSGFVDLGIAVRSQDLESPRAINLISAEAADFEANIMREMLAEMTKSDRLSTTFRFRTGSSQLDERAILDFRRLVNYLASKPEGTHITFVGFSDDVGEFEPNRNLSRGRAEQVMTELQAFGAEKLAHITMSATGFGEISPSACNTSERGREINRRVEVWISKS